MKNNWFKKSIKKIKTDDFISRLRSSVIGEGMLHEGNIYLMDYAIKNIPNNGIVFEIGSYAGLSTNLLLHLLEKHNQIHKLYSCDAWIYEGYHDCNENIKTYIDGREDIDRVNYMNYIKNAFINASQLLHPKRLPYTCHLYSDNLFKKWNLNENLTDVFGRQFTIQENIAFAYIDGDHSYKQTKSDFENVDSKLLVNGFVLIDDSGIEMPFGSAKFAKEVRKYKNYKLIATNPNHLFQKIR